MEYSPLNLRPFNYFSNTSTLKHRGCRQALGTALSPSLPLVLTSCVRTGPWYAPLSPGPLLAPCCPWYSHRACGRAPGTTPGPLLPLVPLVLTSCVRTGPWYVPCKP